MFLFFYQIINRKNGILKKTVDLLVTQIYDKISY